MKNFLPALYIFIAFISCNNSNPVVQSDNISLTPINKIQVYTDAVPLNKSTIAKSISIKSNGKKQNVYQFKEIPENIGKSIRLKNQVITGPGIKASVAKETITSTLPVSTTSNSGVAISNEEISTNPGDVSAPVILKNEKNGWSNAKSGAVIGGVGGAIGGAIVSRKKVKGAIVGGIIGAAGGYIFGKTKDNKSVYHYPSVQINKKEID